MLSLPPGVLASERDYLDLTPGGPRCELIEGELRMAPAPNLRHQRVSRNLEFIIHRYLQAHPIGEILRSDQCPGLDIPLRDVFPEVQ